MVNLDATDVSSTIASRIADILFTSTDPASVIEQARRIFDDLQHGRIDRSMFTDNANAYFNEQAVNDFKESLKPLGRPGAFTQTSRLLRGGMIARRFEIKFPKKTLHVTTFTLPDGKIEQYMVAAAQ
jgi:hypothetical protein